MYIAKEYSLCFVCLKTTRCAYFPECRHCRFTFCYQCLLKHQHEDLYERLCEQIENIDRILDSFVGYAHSSTEWVQHLTEDKNELKIFVLAIERTPLYSCVHNLPEDSWLTHIDDLIKKNSEAIYEDCNWLLKPEKNHSKKRK